MNDEEAVEKRRKLLTTLDVDVTPDPGRPPEPTRMVKTGGGPDQDQDLAVIVRHATKEELAGLAGLINERLHKKHGENLYWKCDKCGAVEVSPGDADIEGRGCLRCNWMSWKIGGHVRRLRGADLKAYLKLAAESEKRALEQMKEQQKKADEAFRMKVAGGGL